VFILCGFIHYLVCRCCPLDALIIFTTTISVSNMYGTNIVVTVPIIWLCIAIVVVVMQLPPSNVTKLAWPRWRDVVA